MNNSRLHTFYLFFLFGIAGIILRLAYWQLIKGGELRVEARDQYQSSEILTPARGEIITADNYPLVINEPIYNLTAYTPHIEDTPISIADQITPLLEFDIADPAIATDEAKREAKLKDLAQIEHANIVSRLSNKNYAILARSLSIAQKRAISQLGILGLDFEEGFTRAYPESSMSAHLAGFVGRDDLGEPTGYFGLEGYYDRELRGKAGITLEEKDATGNPLILGDFRSLEEREGRTLKLHLERSVQYLVEEALADALERYGAVSGEVLVMDSQTGGILAMASLPAYDPAKFYHFDSSLYKNPSVASTYEPGSTFKVLVMAAALEEGVVKPDDHCDICTGPLPIDKYTIKTWDGKYHPDSTPSEILANSDNVGMVWAERKLGGEKLLAYLDKYGFGKKTGIDLQEEAAAPLRDKWSEIDYATASFGQGIAITSIQLLTAVNTIASGGYLLEPHVVQEVIGDTSLPIETNQLRRVLSDETVATITSMMIDAAEHGDAKWTRLPDYTVAGKTGTAQIPVQGHYDANKTITSFIGFAPANNPRFTMLVKLREPQTSIWGSETAAPLWFSLAKKLLLHYQIPPNNL